MSSTTDDGAATDLATLSEARYRGLFNAIDEGFCIIEFFDGPHGPNSDYIHIEANPAYATQTGIPDVVGVTLRNLVPDEADGWLEIYGRVLETGEPVRFERDFVTVDRVIDVFAFRVEPKELRQVGVLFRDITARRRAEQQLRSINVDLEERVAKMLAERRLLAEVIEGADVLVQVADTNFNFLAINRASADEFERIYGVRPRAGDNMLTLLDDQPEHRDAVRGIWSRALAGEEFTEVGEFGDPGRARRSYEMKFSQLRDAEGKTIGAYQFVYDVTDRLRDDARLRDAEEALRQSQKLETMGQLTGGVAHDINNLLTPIVGALDVLKRKLGDDERAQRLVGGGLQAAERAATLVQRLLAFSRRQILEPRPVDVRDLIENITDLMQRTLGPQIEIRITSDPHLPLARVDRNQLELALLNLAVNARDALGGKGVVEFRLKHCRITSHQRAVSGDYVCIQVIDEGVGMDAETLRRATEPFFTTKGVGQGTGLGLSSVHGIAEQLGGMFELESEPGKGTVASLCLPATHDVADEALAARTVAARQGVGVGLSVLLVDDDPLVRQSARDTLEQGGYIVTEAASANIALELIEKGYRPAIIVTDYAMPKMNGVELVQRASAIIPGLPAVLVSGFVADTDVVQDYGLPLVAKPFDPDSLLSVVAARLREG